MYTCEQIAVYRHSHMTRLFEVLVYSELCATSLTSSNQAMYANSIIYLQTRVPHRRIMYIEFVTIDEIERKLQLNCYKHEIVITRKCQGIWIPKHKTTKWWKWLGDDDDELEYEQRDHAAIKSLELGRHSLRDFCCVIAGRGL